MFEMKKMPNNNTQYVKSRPVITLDEGQKLLVRIYPWYNTSVSGKLFCLSDLTIHGMAVYNESDIDVLENNINKTVQYYTIDGRLQSEPNNGLNLVKMKDGSVRKVVIK